MKKFIFVFFVFLFAWGKVHAQTLPAKKNTVQKVLDKIAEAYCSAKPVPTLVLLGRNQNESVIAEYIFRNEPIVKIDEKLVDICLGFKADSLNALAVIIGHELAHYYKGHNFCIEYAYAQGKKSGLTHQILKYEMSPESKMLKEYEADHEGYFYAVAAGYDPSRVFEKMIDTIYREYQLSDATKGYPSRLDRKKTKADCQRIMSKLLLVFRAGNILNRVGKYEAAAACFDHIKIAFRSREIFNNAAVSRLLAALELKTNEQIQFIYPIELDPVSRLNGYSTRGFPETTEKLKALLVQAEKDLSTAINLDPTYSKAYINYACLLDINHHPLGAIDKLTHIPFTDTAQYANTITLVKAIAYYHEPDTIKSIACFKMLVPGNDSIIDFNIKLFELRDEDNGISMEKYKNEWKKRNDITDITEDRKKYFNDFILKNESRQTIPYKEKIIIQSNKNNTCLDIFVNNKKLLRAARYGNTNEWIIKIESILPENKSNYKQWMSIKL